MSPLWCRGSLRFAEQLLEVGAAVQRVELAIGRDPVRVGCDVDRTSQPLHRLVVETAGREPSGAEVERLGGAFLDEPVGCVGDEVFGTTGHGSLAELTRASPRRLARKPAALSFEEAAAVPVSAQTALQALRDKGRVQAGQSVLVVGASGGVGSYAVVVAAAPGEG